MIVAYEIKQEPSGDDAHGPAGQNELAENWKQADDAAKRLEAELAAERLRSAQLREKNAALRQQIASAAAVAVAAAAPRGAYQQATPSTSQGTAG